MFDQCSGSGKADCPYITGRDSSDSKKAAGKAQVGAGNDTPLHAVPMFREGLTDRGVRSFVSLSDCPDVAGRENLYGGETVAAGEIGAGDDLPGTAIRESWLLHCQTLLRAAEPKRMSIRINEEKRIFCVFMFSPYLLNTF